MQPSGRRARRQVGSIVVECHLGNLVLRRHQHRAPGLGDLGAERPPPNWHTEEPGEAVGVVRTERLELATEAFGANVDAEHQLRCGRLSRSGGDGSGQPCQQPIAIVPLVSCQPDGNTVILGDRGKQLADRGVLLAAAEGRCRRLDTLSNGDGCRLRNQVIVGREEIEVVGRQEVHCCAHCGQVDHPHPDAYSVGWCPVITPPCETGPTGSAQDPRAQRRHASIFSDTAGVERQGEQFGGVGWQFGDLRARCFADHGGESAITAGDSKPRTVEAVVSVGELPRRVSFVDEGCTPSRHDLVERAGAVAVLSGGRRFRNRTVKEVPAEHLDGVCSSSSEVDRLLIDEARQVTSDRSIEVIIGHGAPCVLRPIGAKRQMGARPEPPSGRAGGIGEGQIGESAKRVDRNERGQGPVGRSDRAGGSDVGDQTAPVAGAEMGVR